MSTLTLKIEKLSPEVEDPKYGTPGSACFDIFAFKIASTMPEDFAIGSGIRSLVLSTGLKFDVPEGWAMKIHSRSGHGFKHDIRLCNSTGVIDSDFTGEVMVKLTADTISGCAALGEMALSIFEGKTVAICQAELTPVHYVDFSFEVVDKQTERGAKGFGSTDKAV